MENYNLAKTSWHDLTCYMMEFHNPVYRKALEEEYMQCRMNGLIRSTDNLEMYVKACPDARFQAFVDEAYKQYQSSPDYETEMEISAEGAFNDFLDSRNSEFTYEDIMYKVRTSDLSYKAELSRALKKYDKWEINASNEDYTFGYNGLDSTEPKESGLSPEEKAWNDLKNFMMVSINPKYNQLLEKVYNNAKENGMFGETTMASEDSFNKSLERSTLSYEDIMFAVRCEDKDYLAALTEAYNDYVEWSKRIDDPSFGQNSGTPKPLM